MALFGSKKKSQLPRHICLVPDAGRLAPAPGAVNALLAQGAERLSALLQACTDYAIPHLSVLVAPSAADYSLEMVRVFLRTQAAVLQTLQVRLVVSEPQVPVDARLQTLLHALQEQTAAHSGTTLVVAPRADGRAAILQAVQAWQRETGFDLAQRLTEESLAQHMPLGQIPDPDLVLRTGCQVGSSVGLENTLLWQAAYSELYFCETAWQDFSVQHFDDALAWYGRRERRFGGVTAPPG